jgi:AraC-like DNA-binding protein
MTHPTLQTVAAKPKGVVDPATARRMFRMERYLPSPDLAPFLDHHWVVEWDLRGHPPHVQRTLPYPCVNLVFDRGRTAVFGVISGAFNHTLQGANHALGLRFKAGAFRAFLGGPVSEITDKIVDAATLLRCDIAEAEAQVLGAEGDAARVAAAEALLRRVLPAPDPQVERIQQILRFAEQDPTLRRVKALAEHAGCSVRSLQQLFNDHVGVGPKWVICRYRLHEAAEQLGSGSAVDLASLAQSLGYFDQAHFTSDFEKLVGKPPAQYRREAGGG